jgi:hypothetical protein
VTVGISLVTRAPHVLRPGAGARIVPDDGQAVRSVAGRRFSRVVLVPITSAPLTQLPLDLGGATAQRQPAPVRHDAPNGKGRAHAHLDRVELELDCGHLGNAYREPSHPDASEPGTDRADLQLHSAALRLSGRRPRDRPKGDGPMISATSRTGDLVRRRSEQRRTGRSQRRGIRTQG